MRRQLVAILSSALLAACAALYGVTDVPPVQDGGGGEGGGAEGGDAMMRPGAD